MSIATRHTAPSDEIQHATERWPELNDAERATLSALVSNFKVSVAAGDVRFFDGNWYVTHSGLLRIAERKHCSGIQSEVVHELSDPVASRWVVKATVYKTAKSKGFVGYGDADPSNVSDLVRGAELRMAETRAVNRALRKAYGIGLCSLEEIGSSPDRLQRDGHQRAHNNGNKNNGHDAQPARLRDRLLLLIRQHGLDASQVKGFAEHFCGDKPLREATRQEVESFLQHLTELLSQDREHALEVLSRYAALANADDAAAQVSEPDPASDFGQSHKEAA